MGKLESWSTSREDRTWPRRAFGYFIYHLLNSHKKSLITKKNKKKLAFFDSVHREVASARSKRAMANSPSQIDTQIVDVQSSEVESQLSSLVYGSFSYTRFTFSRCFPQFQNSNHTGFVHSSYAIHLKVNQIVYVILFKLTGNQM